MVSNFQTKFPEKLRKYPYFLRSFHWKQRILLKKATKTSLVLLKNTLNAFGDFKNNQRSV